MAISRIDWLNGTFSGKRIVPVVLVAGVPIILTPAGVEPSYAAVTSGTVDPLFWPGTGSLQETLPGGEVVLFPKAFLDPRETFEVVEKVDLLKGSVTVEPLTFTVQDILGGYATLYLSNKEGRTSQPVAADVLQAATTVTLTSTVGMPTSGMACIGRETITYDGVSGGALQNVVRGKYGSQDRLHTSPESHRPVCIAGLPRLWQGRLATVWLCTLSDDTNTINDPTLLYIGTVGAGVQMTNNLMTWSIPLDHVTESLVRKVTTPPISLYGYAHYERALASNPLSIAAAIPSVSSDLIIPGLRDDATSPYDQGGWHPSRESFFDDSNRKVRSLTSNLLSVALRDDGRATVFKSGSSPSGAVIDTCWDTFASSSLGDTTDNTAWVSSKPAPEACFPLTGWVKIPRAEDFAGVPSTLTYSFTTPTGAEGTATISLLADSDTLENLCCPIVERDATNQRIRVQVPLEEIGRVLSASSSGRSSVLCTKRTQANLAIVAVGDNTSAALQAGAKALDALAGQDIFQTVVDWVDMERALGEAPSGGLPQARRYTFVSGADSFLEILIQELRIRGMCLSVRYGKLTGIRLQNFSNAENAVCDLVESDTLSEAGREIPVGVVDNSGSPLATSMTFEIPNGTEDPTMVVINDVTWQNEFSDGESLECKALKSIPVGLFPDLNTTQGYLFDVAQQVLGPLAEPERTLTLALSPVYMGLQAGMLVRYTHSRIPGWGGTRGFSDIVCQVKDVQRSFCGGKFRVTVGLRYQSGSYYGYAPEALVAAGGLSTMTPVVTLDTTTPWGASCFAQDTDANGLASTNATDGFAVGDTVVLSQIGSLTPSADEQRTIVAIDPVANTITLSAAPGATMAANAATQYSVLIRYAPYSACASTQQTLYAWVADETTQVLGIGAPPKQWAP